MKVNLMRSYDSHGSSFPLRKPKEKNGSMCAENNYNENRGYYSGSFTGTGEATANVWNKMDNFLNWTSSRKVVSNAILAFIVAGLMRPAFLMGTSSKENKENNTYASAHAIASGVIGLTVSSILMFPFQQAKDNLDKERSLLPGNIVTNNILNNENLTPEEKLGLLKRNIKRIDKKLAKALNLEDKGAIIDKLTEFKSKEEIGKLLHDASDNADYTKSVKNYLKMSEDLSDDVLKNLSNNDIEKFIQGGQLTIKKTEKNKLKVDELKISLKESSEKLLKKWVNLKDIIKVKNEAFHLVDMLPETVAFGPMKAMLTIALIPPILKYVFGLEKKKKTDSKQPVQTDTVRNDKVPPRPSIEKFIGGNK